ncbi:MAG: phospholipase D-like domain-containing protein, partial [Halothece sp.]
PETVSLEELSQTISAIAVKNNCRHFQQVYNHFGLDFLPQTTVRELFALETSLFDLPPSSASLSSPCRYRYQFQINDSNVILELSPDDSQLPSWEFQQTTQEGCYEVTVEDKEKTNLPDDIIRQIRSHCLESWENLSPPQQLASMLTSLQTGKPCLETDHLQLWLKFEEVSSPEVKTAINVIQNQQDIYSVAKPIRELILQYLPPSSRNIPKTLSPQPREDVRQIEFPIKRKHRRKIEKLISNADQFLLISSYIIEDENITNLICEKAKQLPQGVWILTDLREEVIDWIDTQTENDSPSHQETNHRKKTCLRQLLNSGVSIRSGKFHLKTYISEKEAYLGSCNLTGGSLDFNLEAGILTCYPTLHQNLILMFQQFWETQSKDQVIPLKQGDGFYLHSLSLQTTEITSDYFLTPQQYEDDLMRQLQRQNDSITIYTRRFSPSPQLARLLRYSQPNIFVNEVSTDRIRNFPQQTISHLHAKVTILGNRVAYLGGINFTFSRQSQSFVDLMYKTTSSDEINSIRKQLSSSIPQ